ncbi:MAG: hypothetical protein LBQ34_05225 [Alphaproteobacteria bacterium]|jgi:hypothetical protein|nr:hypothetical protein [Alphaproteobacteria bacterium]
MLKKSFLILLLLYLSACAMFMPKNMFNKDKFEQGGYAVIAFTQENNIIQTTFGAAGASSEVSTVATFRNKATGEEITLGGPKNVPATLMIAAGEYELVRLFTSRSEKINPKDPNQNSEKLTVEMNLPNVVGGFTVQSGDVVYLGQINVNVSGPINKAFFLSKDDFVHEDDFKVSVINNFKEIDKLHADYMANSHYIVLGDKSKMPTIFTAGVEDMTGKQIEVRLMSLKKQ